MAFQDRVVNGVPLTRESFTNPPLEMGIVPFWFWNGDLDYDELEWQLRQYHEKGVRSLFIHGRMGLRVPYLSDDWFDRVAFVVEKARQIGIDTWVYDEMDWPSGTADKQVLEKDPNLGQRYLDLVALNVDGPLFTFLEAHDSRYVNTGNSNPVAAYGVRRHEYHNGIRELIDLTKNLSWEKTIPWEAPAGRWMLLYFLEKEAPYYIDTLDPESTATFIELTHERYKQAVGHEFGKTVPGFFTDEPAMYYYQVGVINHVVPWSKQMFKIFRERRGYDLKPYLPALYTDMGERTVQVRYDFWRTLTEQYAETYYKQLRDWCDEHDLIFTGHLLFEEHLRLAARCEGNLFKYLQHLHLIGVDHLYPKIGTPQDPAQHVALKVGSSAAHHFGSTRLLCESMGGTYWDCTLERMKWMNNWEYVLGVNLFNNHGYHYTIEGERKRDWPPSQFYHHTWWKYYDHFTRYNARLSHLLSGGRHVAKVLMLYPINSMWVNYTPQQRTRVSDVIELDFDYLTDTLLRLHYDFDYVDEDVLADATIEDGTITIRDEVYSVFILPPVTHIKASTYEQLQAFVESGGSLICCTLLPVGLLEAGPDGQVGVIDGFFAVDPDEELKTFSSPGQAAFEVLHQNTRGNVFFFRGSGLFDKKLQVERLLDEAGVESPLLDTFFRVETGLEWRDTVKDFLLAETTAERERAIRAFLEEQGELEQSKKDELRRVLHACAVPDVTVSDEEVFYLHREKDGFDIYYFVNTSTEDRGRVTITFERMGRPEHWNPNTGAVRPMPVYREENGRLVLNLDFPPSEAHVVVLRGEAGAPHVEASNLWVDHFEEGRVVGYAAGETEEVFARVVTEEGKHELRTEAREPRPPIVLSGPFRFDVEQDNVLVIDRWKMWVESDSDRAERYAQPEYDATGWLDVTNGAWEMQLPQERDEQVYPVTLWYRTHFEIRDLPANTRLMVDGFSGSEYQLFINGREVEDEGTRSRLDAEIREVDIQPYIRPGRNTVVVRLVVNRRTDGMLDLLKIVGDFAVVDSVTGGYEIARRPAELGVGDWTNQGYPFYSGTGVYSGRVEVPAEYLDGGRIFLQASCGSDVLEVRVNGSEGRVVPWPPYRLDVTDLLQEGGNTVEFMVTNTLLNILEGEPRASGLFEPPRLVHEHRYELVVPT